MVKLSVQAFLVLYKAPLSGHTTPSLLFLLSNWWYIGRARVSKRVFFLLVSSTMERFLRDPQHKQMLFEIHLYFFSPSLSVFFFWNSLQDTKEEKRAESNTTEQNCCLSLTAALNPRKSFVVCIQHDPVIYTYSKSACCLQSVVNVLSCSLYFSLFMLITVLLFYFYSPIVQWSTTGASLLLQRVHLCSRVVSFLLKL